MRTIALTILLGGLFVSWRPMNQSSERVVGPPRRPPSPVAGTEPGHQARHGPGGPASGRPRGVGFAPGAVPFDSDESTGPASEDATEAGARRATPALPELLVLHFPLREPPPFGDSFGDPRPGGRRHEGVDLMAPKRTPVHAAAAGSVRWTHDEAGGRCCAVALVHESGWRTRYLHLDNDTPGTDDGLTVGIAPGIEPGAWVEAGDLIGWVGDSGNAEEVGSHLHFELRDPQGRAINATPLLQEAAERRREEIASSREAAAQ